MIRDLLDQFECVRLVQMNGIDLSLFQFDHDLTFAVFFLNADETIYGRFGTRAAKNSETEPITLEGLRASMEAALQLHRDPSRFAAGLAAKRGPKPDFAKPEEYPSLNRFQPRLDFSGKVAASCIHCHQVREAERRKVRGEKTAMSDRLLFPYPMPDVLGASLDPKSRATVVEVAEGSPAHAAGVRVGDELTVLAGQPLVSLADVQWVLHHAPDSGSLAGTLRRNGATQPVTITLSAGWRRKSEISWRTSSWDLRRMATGGMVLEPLSDERRAALELPDDAMGLNVKFVGQYGEHAIAKNAGLRKDDVIVEWDGRGERLREADVFAIGVQQRAIGDRVNVVVLRDGKRMKFELRLQ